MPRARDLPGPGQYEIPHFLSQSTRAVSLKIGNRTGTQFENSPGPADYVVAPGSPAQKLSKRIRFGKAQRFGRIRDDTPGPCQYSPINPIVISERRSIGEKTGVKLPGVSDVTPGPGAYNPVKVAETLDYGTSFYKGSTRWMIVNHVESPGPAAYMADKEASKNNRSNGFGGGPRLFEKNAADTPGPGSYTWDLKSGGPKISMTPRREIEN
mmetsp:Transcript_73191/g.89828  ORF Transcript_73191/g.89828 Transcript_73191/m.89828 type:complete len:211 (-) Transcript_73191:45-677(-)|eukprot:CAMPEP_0114682664 /NCGR_PEP_ID=MMETSP0191-20121206/56868_1 /TAXON_ID=126664 /ORGANISM="Sorites sp." /LENGTH=210 /DNA_ID=CAMNT_0001962701 /DNA_START=56 /DNA_END=688 /DNA_ORIENTATION=+